MSPSPPQSSPNSHYGMLSVVDLPAGDPRRISAVQKNRAVLAAQAADQIADEARQNDRELVEANAIVGLCTTDRRFNGSSAKSGSGSTWSDHLVAHRNALKRLQVLQSAQYIKENEGRRAWEMEHAALQQIYAIQHQKGHAVDAPSPLPAPGDSPAYPTWKERWTVYQAQHDLQSGRYERVNGDLHTALHNYYHALPLEAFERSQYLELRLAQEKAACQQNPGLPTPVQARYANLRHSEQCAQQVGIPVLDAKAAQDAAASPVALANQPMAAYLSTLAEKGKRTGPFWKRSS